MSSFASVAGLFVAELDLKLVESVLSAIRTADIQSGQDKTAPLPIMQNPLPAEPVRVYQDHVAERVLEHPAAAVVYSCRRCNPAPAAVPVVIETVVVQKAPDELCSPLAPPWKSLPWDQPPHLPAIIKIVQYTPDIRYKGTLLDCFV